jgi:BCD family chlorophyll transporter-like MFS transporter
MSGAVRDISSQVFHGPVNGYVIVFILEALMLVASLLLLKKIDVRAFQRRASSASVIERMATAAEV